MGVVRQVFEGVRQVWGESSWFGGGARLVLEGDPSWFGGNQVGLGGSGWFLGF